MFDEKKRKTPKNGKEEGRKRLWLRLNLGSIRGGTECHGAHGEQIHRRKRQAWGDSRSTLQEECGVTRPSGEESERTEKKRKKDPLQEQLEAALTRSPGSVSVGRVREEGEAGERVN